MRRLKPLKGGRRPTWSGLDPALRRWAEREAARYDVSVSFVVNNAISFVSGVEAEEYYARAQAPKMKVVRRW
jgi:hypothetical protein